MTDHLSPSGRYCLSVTSTDSWQSRGVIEAVPSPGTKPLFIATIDRNYGAFPFLFIEGHPDGHDYLICGEDYQGQTVIQIDAGLDCGKRQDVMSPGSDRGHGFCWSEYRFDVASKILVVAGCIWAAPYEYRFYDFSDPANGWPALEITGEGQAWDDSDQAIWEDPRWPVITVDGDQTTIECFQTERADDDDEDDDSKLHPIAATTTLRRDGAKLVFVGEEVSEAEQIVRRERAEGQARFKKWMEDFRTSDPLYLIYKERLEKLKAALPEPLTASEYESHGITHDNWSPDFKKQERRWCHRIVERKRDEKGVLDNSTNVVIDLEWAVETGPIKLEVYRGKHGYPQITFFEHSPTGMHEAFDRALKEVT